MSIALSNISPTHLSHADDVHMPRYQEKSLHRENVESSLGRALIAVSYTHHPSHKESEADKDDAKVP